MNDISSVRQIATIAIDDYHLRGEHDPKLREMMIDCMEEALNGDGLIDEIFQELAKYKAIRPIPDYVYNHQ